jgi:hypothetical protein
MRWEKAMKPMLFIFGTAFLMMLIGWTWSEMPRPARVLAPTWTRSYQLYRQPHAIWLDRYDAVGANIEELTRTLKAAARGKQIPELVVYAIPMRDLGQSSEGGFASYDDYLADNRLSADLIQKFVTATGIHPVIYLEPDSIPLAVQYRRDHNHSPESQQIYSDRIRVIKALIDVYQAAGAQVYLEAGHSGWFDYGDEDVQRIADALNEADIRKADGLATNVSNRQPVLARKPDEYHELHYLRRLLSLLENKSLDIRVDTSRNGGPSGSFQARQYYLAPDGRLIDNEIASGRLVGVWEPDARRDIWLFPYYGEPKPLKRLTGKEKYTYNAQKRILSAPPWLDAVGDVKPGPSPTDSPPETVAQIIQHYRYIKPPDDCDGSLNCPPGASKSLINAATANRQPPEKLDFSSFWLR